MSLAALLEQLSSHPETVEFDQVMAVIDAHYQYTPAAFTNGDLHNAAGDNAGSCKIFAFAQLNDLDQQATLACFGQYYRGDTLNNPDGNDHQNIRNFIKHSWPGIHFETAPLVSR